MKPFKFEPLLKQTLWGGEKIIPFKHLKSDLHQVGESWEVSGVEGSESIVANGPYKGKKLNEVVMDLKEKLVGKANYERFQNEFPLLIKFIDAQQDLSIQVHPSDEDAITKFGKNRGKTEMWYVMKSEPYAHLRVGLKQKLTPDEYEKMVNDGTICDALNDYPVKEGDVFFIKAGRIHSIGKGTFLAEIQETSDTTFRIYDFKRKDKNGHYRELHTAQAKQCIDFTVLPDYQTHYIPKKDEPVEVARSPYFTTTVYDLTEKMTMDYSELDSFVVLMGLKGQSTVTDNEGHTLTLNEGETIVLPATTESIQVTPASEGMKVLESYV